jgi:catechol 2,3-dioxygenase-like lactoylglutathione lyase family enzyme
MTIQFQPPVIFVKDMAVSRQFYENLLDQKVLMDFGPCVSFEGGFALWHVDHAFQMIFNTPVDDTSPLGRKNFEFCFEADDLDAVLAKVTAAQRQLVCSPHEQPWGQRVFHIYDPDGHIVEIGEAMPTVILRFMSQGMSAEDAAHRTGMPIEFVQHVAQTENKKERNS